jgi:hypothetical protein
MPLLPLVAKPLGSLLEVLAVRPHAEKRERCERSVVDVNAVGGGRLDADVNFSPVGERRGFG